MNMEDSSMSGSDMSMESKHFGMTADFSCSADVIFSSIQISENCFQLFLAGLVLALISILYEYIVSVKSKATQNLYQANIKPDFVQKLYLSFLYLCHITLLYLVMMGIMTYNMWLVLVIIIFNGIGYYLFVDFGRKAENNGCCNFH